MRAGRPFLVLYAFLAGAPLLCGFHRSIAQQVPHPGDLLDQIVVTGRKITADEAMTQQVAAALHDSPYVVDDHVDITAKNGIVTLSGLALDNWDVQVMIRAARRMPGVRKVVNKLDVVMTGD